MQIPCSQGGKPKKFTLQEANQKKKKLQGGKTKLTHITGGMNLFTQHIINERVNRLIPYIICVSFVFHHCNLFIFDSFIAK